MVENSLTAKWALHDSWQAIAYQCGTSNADLKVNTGLSVYLYYRSQVVIVNVGKPICYVERTLKLLVHQC